MRSSLIYKPRKVWLPYLFSNFFSRINQTSPFHKFIYLFLYISLDSYQTLDSTFYIFLGNLPNQTQEHIRYALYFLFHGWWQYWQTSHHCLASVFFSLDFKIISYYPTCPLHLVRTFQILIKVSPRLVLLHPTMESQCQCHMNSASVIARSPDQVSSCDKLFYTT